MKNTAQLTREQKVEIVAKFFQTADPVKTTFAKRHNISTSSLNRYIKSFGEEAKKLVAKDAPKTDGRGYKGRNGRWNIIWGVFDKLGADADTKVIIEEINKESKKMGLNPLRKASASSMVSIARKSLREKEAAHI